MDGGSVGDFPRLFGESDFGGNKMEEGLATSGSIAMLTPGE